MSHPAQLLLTVVEDNKICIEHLVSSLDHTVMLTDILTFPFPADADTVGLPLKASITGKLSQLGLHWTSLPSFFVNTHFALSAFF